MRHVRGPVALFILDFQGDIPGLLYTVCLGIQVCVFVVVPAGELTLLAHVAVEIRVAIELADHDGEPYRSVLRGHPVTPSVSWRVEAEVVLSVAHPADVVVHLRLPGKDHGVVIDQDPGAVYVSIQGTGEL